MTGQKNCIATKIDAIKIFWRLLNWVKETKWTLLRFFDHA